MDDETLTNRLGEILGRLPTFVWSPGDDDPLPTANEIAVAYGAIPDEPDRAVGIRVYSPIDEPDLLKRRVQLHVRGRPWRPFDADRIAGVLFTVLHERPRGDGFASILRTSVGDLQTDDNGRAQRTENYLITLDNLEAFQ